MNYYLYFYFGVEPDIAVVEGKSKDEAIVQLKKFYNNVSANNVIKIDCHRKGYVDGIMIIKSY